MSDKNRELSPQKALARKYGCDVSTIKRYKAAGAPLDKPEQMKVWIASQRCGPERAPLDNPISEAKLRKLELECEKLVRQNDEAKGILIAIDDVRADMGRIASAMQSRLSLLVGECPNWAGLQAHELQSKAKEFVRATHEAFHDATGKLYAP